MKKLLYSILWPLATLPLLLVGSPNVFADAPLPTFKVTSPTQTVGTKVQETRDHLSSVAATVSDSKQANNSDTTLQAPSLRVVSWQATYAYNSFDCNNALSVPGTTSRQVPQPDGGVLITLP